MKESKKNDLKDNIGVAVWWLFLLSLAVLFIMLFVNWETALLFAITLYLPIVISVVNVGNCIFSARRFEPLIMFGVVLGFVLYVMLANITVIYMLNDKGLNFRLFSGDVYAAEAIILFVYFAALFTVGFLSGKVKPTVLIFASVIVVIAGAINFIAAVFCLVMWVKYRFDLVIFLMFMYNADIFLLSARYLKHALKTKKTDVSETAAH